MRRVVPAAVALLLGACGGGGGGPSGATTTAKPPASCPGAAGQYSGPTSEKLCVTAERDASGNITLFDIQVLARCSVGFSESKLTVSDVTGPQTLTTTEAPSEANAPFKATVSIKPPITVGADGTFKSDNLSGTIAEAQARGSYELQLAGFGQSAAGAGAFTCTGDRVTWTATRS